MEETKEQSTHKTLADDEAITAFLNRRYPRGFSNLKRIQGGQLSQAFSFEGGGKKLIYSCLIFLRVLGFFARTEQKRRVEKLKVRLRSLL